MLESRYQVEAENHHSLLGFQRSFHHPVQLLAASFVNGTFLPFGVNSTLRYFHLISIPYVGRGIPDTERLPVVTTFVLFSRSEGTIEAVNNFVLIASPCAPTNVCRLSNLCETPGVDAKTIVSSAKAIPCSCSWSELYSIPRYSVWRNSFNRWLKRSGESGSSCLTLTVGCANLEEAFSVKAVQESSY